MYMFETLSDIMVQTKSSFMSSFYPKRKKFSVEKSTRSSQENGRYYLKPSVWRNISDKKYVLFMLAHAIRLENRIKCNKTVLFYSLHGHYLKIHQRVS